MFYNSQRTSSNVGEIAIPNQYIENAQYYDLFSQLVCTSITTDPSGKFRSMLAFYPTIISFASDKEKDKGKIKNLS